MSEKGLIYTITGDGKGKTSSALGMAMRFLGWDLEISIIQFIKSAESTTGEQAFFKRFFPNTLFLSSGLGFTFTSGDHQSYAQACWKKTKEYINTFKGDLLILDELNIALYYNYIDITDVIQTLEKRPFKLNIIITGRYAKNEIMEISDLVSEIKNLKHPYDSGLKARKGLDF